MTATGIATVSRSGPAPVGLEAPLRVVDGRVERAVITSEQGTLSTVPDRRYPPETVLAQPDRRSVSVHAITAADPGDRDDADDDTGQRHADGSDPYRAPPSRP